MIIQRISVEGGFLDGLDLPLTPGLNVLIGERGTGKTSVVELLRYTLGAGSLVDDGGATRDERARSILGDGAVHVELATPDGTIEISRSYRDDAPRTTTALPSWTVVGQGEMEAIGLEAANRIRLLDRYAMKSIVVEQRDANAALSAVRSLTEQLARVTADLRRVDEDLEPLTSVPEMLEHALREQKSGLESANATEEESRQLVELQSAVERLQGTISQVAASASIAGGNHEVLTSAKTQWRDLHLPVLDGDQGKIAAAAHHAIENAYDLLTRALTYSSQASDLLGNLQTQLDASLARLDQQTRRLRARLDEMRAGLSAAARAVENLREQAGTRSALLERREQLTAEAAAIAEARRVSYSDVDRLRERRRDRRIKVAFQLNQQYGPEVLIDVAGGANRGRFAAAIVDALTGSGLHYNTLAPLIAESMTPLELVEAAEQMDGDSLAASAGIPTGRAAQVALQLTSSKLADLVLSPIDDSASFQLLDGTDYKPMANLSIGQRCTVVLPVLLGAPTTGLILDQPEDNLDNAFLATTIVPGIVDRAASSQVIIATHNPNIPVLGDAKQVVHMGSDGTRGFVISVGPLSDPATRTAITDIMEGGREAFERRAAFYGPSTR